MTRANFLIITRQGKFKFQANSSAYPSYMGSHILEFAISTASTNGGATNGFYDSPDSRELANFIEGCCLTFGHVGNPSYFYEIDFVKQHVKAWDSRLSWVNAPLDWRERGWNCWEGKNGKFGYTNWVKGKLIYNKRLSELLDSGQDYVPIMREGIEEELSALG